MEGGIGDLLAILAERGLLENAAILLTSDHGELIDAHHVVESLPLHAGNPAYLDVLDISLVRVGTVGVDIPDFVRSEDLDVSSRHSDVVEAHRRRLEELTRALTAISIEAGPTQPSAEWLERLRVPGTVE